MSEVDTIKWATMIPKIGGSAIGCYKATQSLPQYHLSYTSFQPHDSQLGRYWPQVPFFYLDKLKQTTDYGYIDLLQCVLVQDCPC